MKPVRIVSLLLFFSPLLCFAETPTTTDEFSIVETDITLQESAEENNMK